MKNNYLKNNDMFECRDTGNLLQKFLNTFSLGTYIFTEAMSNLNIQAF